MGGASVAVNIIANHQKRLRLLRGDHIPEIHAAIFIDAGTEGETGDDRVGGQRHARRGAKSARVFMIQISSVCERTCRLSCPATMSILPKQPLSHDAVERE